MQHDICSRRGPLYTEAWEVLRKRTQAKGMAQLEKHDPQTRELPTILEIAGHSPAKGRDRQTPGTPWPGGLAELMSSRFKHLVFKNKVENKGTQGHSPPSTCMHTCTHAYPNIQMQTHKGQNLKQRKKTGSSQKNKSQ